ncbi:MAG: hypothetical protein ACMXYB_00260 [Candidatus Woesearchaeota archaeon]
MFTFVFSLYKEIFLFILYLFVPLFLVNWLMWELLFVFSLMILVGGGFCYHIFCKCIYNTNW